MTRNDEYERYNAALRAGQVEALRDLSRATRVPIAALMREAVDDLLLKHRKKKGGGRWPR